VPIYKQLFDLLHLSSLAFSREFAKPQSLSIVPSKMRGLCKGQHRALLRSMTNLSISSADIGALTMLGQARVDAGDLLGARDAFAMAAECAPLDATAAANHALALLRSGESDAAISEANRALALDPTLSIAQANLGHALLAAGRLVEAAESFALLLKQNATNADAWHGMAMAQRALGNLGAGLAAIEKALRRQPQNGSMLGNQGLMRLEVGDYEAAIESFSAAASTEPETTSHACNALMAMAYQPAYSVETVVRAAIDWSAGLERVTPRRKVNNVKSGSTIRVGIVSADLWQHPVGWLGAQALLHLDSRQFSVLAFDTGSRPDRLNAMFRAGMTWRDVAGWSDAAIADQIEADGVDLLIDLAGHTSGGRPRLFAHKPVLHQASWLGHVGTTGLSTIDVALMDDWHAPEGSDGQFSESLVRLEGGRFAYSPPPEAPEPIRVSGPVTFASFHSLAKLNVSVAALWGSLMEAVPGSRLLIKRAGLQEPWLRKRVISLFEKVGVDPARLILEPPSDHRTMLGTYAQADVALDPFPFCGGATTAEALWMGVPVITLAGQAPASRQSLAMLSAIGRSEWIAYDEQSYIQAAIAALGQTETRAELRELVASSPLGSNIRLARSLEAAFAEICATSVH
jgi:protein O-GlcNAc transferase